MGRCTKGCSRCILLLINTLIFLIAAGALGVTVYIFFDAVGKSLTKVNLLTCIGIAAIALMIFAILGCKTATNPPQKKCSKCMYLTILLLLFLAEIVAAGLIFNVSNALQVAKDNGFNIQSDIHKASGKAVLFLHDQLHDLYDEEECKGGAAKSATVPISFTDVECKTKPVTDAFSTIFADNTVETQEAFAVYKNCTADASFTPAGSPPSDFTQVFCGSEEHIVSLANQYARYLVWFPVMLAGLTFILLVSTICLIAQKDQERRRLVRMQRGTEPLHRVQMGSHV